MKENKLIAEFMELEESPKYNYDNIEKLKEYYIREYNSGEWYLPEEMQYHTSWDWLMPVVKKCLCTGDNTNEWDSLCEALTTCNDYEVYQAVVGFINEYNKQEL